MELSYGLAIPCINPKEVKAGTQTFVHHVHSTIIHNSEKNQATQVFINWWMDKQDVIYTYNGVLFSIKRKEIDTCYNINEPWRHYTSHKREINSSQRTNTLWFHLYEILRLVKFRDKKIEWWLAGESGGMGSQCLVGTESQLVNMRKCGRWRVEQIAWQCKCT